MSEAQKSAFDDQTPQDELVSQQGAGELLKQAREACGLHIAALAVLLKVPVKKLEALESNRLDLLPDAVFTRALASSVCRTLKIDAGPVLARLPQTDSPKLTYQGVGINAPFRSPSDGPGPTVLSQVSRPAVLAGLLLLLGALVLVFLPVIKIGLSQVKSDVIESRATNTANAESEKAVSPIAAVALPSTDVSVLVQTASNAITSLTSANPPLNLKASAAATASTSDLSSPSKVQTAETLSTASSPTSTATLTPPLDTDVIVFTAKGQSWVEATDAKGQTVLRRMLNAGEVVGASGTLPLRVVIGRANETQVQIRGKAFDASAVAKDNVARFEVK